MFGNGWGDGRELVLEEDSQGLVANSGDVAEAGQQAWLQS